MADLGDSHLIRSTEEIAVGDSIYVERTGRTYWVEHKSRNRVKLATVDGGTDSWVRSTLDEAIQAHTWVRQSRCPGRKRPDLDR